jgi:signal transduction histidine kinase
MLNEDRAEILVVDDDAVFRAALRIVLQQHPGDWRVREVGSVSQARAVFAAQPPDLAIVDMHLPDGSAIDVIRGAGSVPCVLCTQDAKEPTFRRLFDDEAAATNVVGYLIKPLPEGAIFSIRTALQLAIERRGRAKLVAQATANLEDERRVIAQNLHDSIGSLLTQLRWVFGGIDRAVSDVPEHEQRQRIAMLCEEGKAILGNAHEEVGRAITRLRPDELSVVGLRGALEYVVSQWRRVAPGVAIAADIGPAVDAVDERHASMLYRIVQEGMTNAMRHAHPVAVELVLDAAAHEICLTIRTQGAIPANRDSYPLTVLRERTSALGGRLIFSVDAGEGTSLLQVLVPR